MRVPVLILILAAAVLPQQGGMEFLYVSREVIEQRLADAPDKAAARHVLLRRFFEQSGCAGERLVEQKVKGSRYPNVVCTAAGELDSVILVGAHFDLASPGKGVVDNWSGASLLPSLSEALSGRPHRHTFVFVGFTGEEEGMIGSRSYVRGLTRQQTAKIRAMVNLDSLGLSTTRLWLSVADKNLSALLMRVARALGSPVAVVNLERVGLSDSVWFRERKVPVLDIHSITQETLPILHTENDNLKAIRLDDYCETYRLVSAYLAFLDRELQ